MKRLLTILTLISTIIIGIFIFESDEVPPEKEKVRSATSPKAPVEMKKARNDYFFKMLRDPKTDQIPPNIRSRELEHAAKLRKSLSKTAKTNEINWKEAGPVDVGGRTRALAVDVDNPDIIIAGGVSGGIWKSTDKGSSWELKSTHSQHLSVSWLIQDTRSGHTDTWYYSTGEYNGNSASDRGFRARFYGTGIYKSTDNGESWFKVSQNNDNPVEYDSPFDYVSKIALNPNTGSLFISSFNIGILKSTDGGQTFNSAMNETWNAHRYNELTITPNGTIVAALSEAGSATPQLSPGIYKSTNDGSSWTNITPSTFPSQHERSVLTYAPSNPNIIYVLTNTGNNINSNKVDMRFHKINLSTGSSEDRSGNLPDYTSGGNSYSHLGTFDPQGNYNMVITVKPDDEDFVLIGGTSLFRSDDAFATKESSAKYSWIGGYHWEHFRYPNLHPDVHSFAWDPTNDDRLWVGHDGGLSYTSDITQDNYSIFFPWTDKNNGYNVTQFYTIAIPDEADDNRMMGGTQDNGTPYFRFDGSSTTSSDDKSTGDGGYAYFGDDYAYVASQGGSLLRVNYDSQGNPNNAFDPGPNTRWSDITPSNAADQLFINPYRVDPNDEDIMYYLAGNSLWRNNSLSSIPDYQNSGTTVGWNNLSSFSAPSGYIYSTLEISQNSAHTLYLGASSHNAAPKLYRIDNANTATSGINDISISAIQSGAYVHSIAVNPNDDSEILVVHSNYGITGLHHSTNSGQSYTAVEGNLDGTQENPGPSIRSATILPTSNGKLYIVGTSTGVYSTSQLNGSNTTWNLEGANTLGNVVVEYVVSRNSDDKVVAATHGRGAFTGNPGGTGVAIASVSVSNLSIEAQPNSTASVNFDLNNTGSATLDFSASASANFGGLSQQKFVIEAYDEPKPTKLTFAGSSGSEKLAAANSRVNKNSSPNETTGDDLIVMDDGDNTADNFLGWGNTNNFSWLNEFILNDYDFTLEGFDFYMKTESASSNPIYVAVYDKDLNVLADGSFSTASLASDGGWFGVGINNPKEFKQGEKFYLRVSTDGSGINLPAAFDYDGQVTDHSYYLNSSGELINLNSNSNFSDGAFLIRAEGTIGSTAQGGLTVSPSSGNINAGGSQQITVTLDSEGIAQGEYSGSVSINSNGGNISIPLSILIDSAVDMDDESEIPGQFALKPNYPNPFNPSTTISFTIPESGAVKLSVYNSLGEKVENLINGSIDAGIHEVTFNAQDLTSGVYYYRIEYNGKQSTEKMILMK